MSWLTRDTNFTLVETSNEYQTYQNGHRLFPSSVPRPKDRYSNQRSGICGNSPTLLLATRSLHALALQSCAYQAMEGVVYGRYNHIVSIKGLDRVGKVFAGLHHFILAYPHILAYSKVSKSLALGEIVIYPSGAPATRYHALVMEGRPTSNERHAHTMLAAVCR